MEKAAFNKKKPLFTNKLDLNFGKTPMKHYIWSIALYGAGTWTLRTADQKYFESSKMWRWKRVEKISRNDRVKNEEVFLVHRVKEERNILHVTKRRETNWTGHILRRKCLLKTHYMEGKIKSDGKTRKNS
jgi:hypothetical protein